MMNQDFDSAAYEAFEQAALDKYDFQTCQRSDGTYYGTGGQCRKGSPVKGTPSKKDKKTQEMRAKDLKARGASQSASDFRTRPKAAIEADMKKLTSSGAMNQKGKAGIDASKKYTDLKAERSKPLKGANSKSGTGTKQQPKKGKWDDFNKKSKAEEDKLRKKYANKKPDGGLTEAQVRAGGGRLD
jgi:hypothetical protein